MNSNTQNFEADATTAPPQDNGSYLSQNKIPEEMLASYFVPSEFEYLTQDFQYMGFDQSQNMMAQMGPYYQYQVPYYDVFLDQTSPYANDFPRAADYSDRKSIMEAFPHLEGLDDPEFNVDEISPNAHFYVLRSSNDDNIHKAIKYHKWSSTPSGKTVLSKAWKEFEEAGDKPEIYFLFTVVNSNQFLGIAKMISDVNPSDSFKYWWEPCKWFGSFQLKWLFVKDIHYSYFEHIREEEHSTSVVNLRDGTKISADSGKEILNVFKHHPIQLNVFDSFEYMDRREDYIRSQRDNDPMFEELFNEYCEAYLNGNDVFYYQKKQYNYRTNGRKNSSNGTRKYSNSSANNNYYNGYYQRPQYYKKYEEKSNSGSQESPPQERYETRTENKRQTMNGGSNYKRRSYNTSYRGERTSNGYFESDRNYGYKTYYERKTESPNAGVEREEVQSRRNQRRPFEPQQNERYRQANEDSNQHLIG